MPILPFQILTYIADLMIITFIGYYLLHFRSKEKEIEKKENKIDTHYHQIVDDALTKERRILEDASQEANQIIAEATNISLESKRVIHEALQKMVADIQTEAVTTSRNFMASYIESLRQITLQSTNDFHKVSKELEEDHQKQMAEFHQILHQSLQNFQHVAQGLETDLQQQIKNFHDTLLPNLEKELDQYKQFRLKQVDQMVNEITQKVSQEVLNKTFSVDDHEKLILDALEKAKQEGTFN